MDQSFVDSEEITETQIISKPNVLLITVFPVSAA